MIKKQTIISLIAVGVAVILGFVYFVFIAPMLEEAPVVRNELLMFPTIELNDVAEIEINNSYGSYGFYYDEGKLADGSDAGFYLKGYYGTEYDKEAFSTLAVAARYPIANEIISENAKEDAAKYGLDISKADKGEALGPEAKDAETVDTMADSTDVQESESTVEQTEAENTAPAWYKIKNKKGQTYKVYIGDLAPSEDRYYAMLEGDNKIYTVDTQVSYILKPVESYVEPYLGQPLGKQDYSLVDRFSISRFNYEAQDLEKDLIQKFIEIEYMTDSEATASASATSYKFVYPEVDYDPSSSKYEEVLNTFVDALGYETVKFDKLGNHMDLEDLAPYGLDKPEYLIEYDYVYKDENTSERYILENVIWVSALNEDGTYYVYSWTYNVVSKVLAETLKFLDWKYIEFVDRPVFTKNINDISEISVEGKDVNAVFYLSGEGQELAVKTDTLNFSTSQVTNFRELYRKMLYISIENYAADTSEENCIMTLKITTRVGQTFEYKFYKYDTLQCFVTVNGKGEFYVASNSIEKILADTKTVANGGSITSELA